MPSQINEIAVAQLHELVDGPAAVLLIDPLSLKAEESLSLRRDLHQAGARMRVAKARLVKRVLPADVQPHLVGHGSLGVIQAPDVAAAAKVVQKLSKEDKILIKGGVVEGKSLDGPSTERLADLPSKQELQSQLLGVLNGVAAKFVRLLNAPQQNLVLILEAYRRKQNGE